MPVSCHPVLVRRDIRMHLCWLCQCCIGAALSVLPYFRKARTQVVYLSRTSDKYTTQCMLEHISQIWFSTRCVCHEQKGIKYEKHSICSSEPVITLQETISRNQIEISNLIPCSVITGFFNDWPFYRSDNIKIHVNGCMFCIITTPVNIHFNDIWTLLV